MNSIIEPWDTNGGSKHEFQMTASDDARNSHVLHVLHVTRVA